MNAPVEFQHLLQLPLETRKQLAEALWDSVEADYENESIPQATLEELRRRQARHEADPSQAIPWSEVQKRLRTG